MGGKENLTADFFFDIALLIDKPHAILSESLQYVV